MKSLQKGEALDHNKNKKMEKKGEVGQILNCNYEMSSYLENSNNKKWVWTLASCNKNRACCLQNQACSWTDIMRLLPKNPSLKPFYTFFAIRFETAYMLCS